MGDRPVLPRLVEAPRKGASGATWQPNDPRYAEQWNFRRIHTEEAWPTNHGRGITVAVYPDNVWYGGVRPEDLEEIFQTHLREGRAVERLLMPDIPWE